MGEQKEKKPMERICAGLLAHVDAGKTTLAESILYCSGAIRRMGRVDHGDAFLDTYALEKARGITIFSKQAEAAFGDKAVTLLDTPGHVDFSAEMERTLQVLDYAILVISGADGVQSHVETLWRLLKRYRIPTFLWINKMDQEGTDREALLKELKEKLDDRCVSFEQEETDAFQEELAVCSEELLEQYMEGKKAETEQIQKLIRERNVFPCYFGSALKMQGIEEFLAGLETYMTGFSYPKQFGARVYKISRDAQGNRLTHMKITGGSLKVKDLLKGTGRNAAGEREDWEEKADQIRVYSGSGYESVQEAFPGQICAVTGLTRTYAGEGLGQEGEEMLPVLTPLLTYQLILPPECDVPQMYRKLRQLEEEEPELHMVWEKSSGTIHVQMMGEVQIEILKNMIQERFGVKAEFGEGNILYKETVASVTEGVGHFEPLRHYAEVHLILEPGERGSGLQFDTCCSEDELDRNWQRLILTHLEEKQHRGVLTGSEITDMKITLAAGRAHTKHTEGGDFRQATYRAVRHGLMQADSILLEPVYSFRMELPEETVGRAMADIQKKSGSFEPPVIEKGRAILTGRVPVSEMNHYQAELLSYTRGLGRLSCTFDGYERCHKEEEIIEKFGYDPEADTENPAGSVFCSHGAGFVVNWQEVRQYMHLEPVLKDGNPEPEEELSPAPSARPDRTPGPSLADDEELQAIFERTYGAVKQGRAGWRRSEGEKKRREENRESAGGKGTNLPGSRERGRMRKNREKEYLLVDGYNIIFAWEELRELAAENIDSARDKLMDILSNYQGYCRNTLILVFDAYKVKGGQGAVQKYHNIYVVYTKEAETADQYIEKTVHEISRNYPVTVATSDALEQMIILGGGASRLSAAGLKEEIEAASREMRAYFQDSIPGRKNYLFECLPDELADLLEEVRLGKKNLKREEKFLKEN